MEKFVVEFPEENNEQKRSRVPPKNLNLGSREKSRLGGKDFKKGRALFRDVIQWRARPTIDSHQDQQHANHSSSSFESSKYSVIQHGIVQVEAEIWCHMMQHFSEFPVALGMSFYRCLANIWIGHSFRPNLLTEARKAQAEHKARDDHTAGGMGKLHPLMVAVLQKSQPRKLQKLSDWERLLRTEDSIEIDSIQVPAEVTQDYFEGMELQEQFDLADLLSRLFLPDKSLRPRRPVFGTALNANWTPYHPPLSQQCLPGLNSLSVLKALQRHGKWPLTSKDLLLVDGSSTNPSVQTKAPTGPFLPKTTSKRVHIDPFFGTLGLLTFFLQQKRYDVVEGLLNLLPPDMFSDAEADEATSRFAIPRDPVHCNHVVALCRNLLVDEVPVGLWGKFIRDHLGSDRSRHRVCLEKTWSRSGVLNSERGRAKVLAGKDILVHDHDTGTSQYQPPDAPHYSVSWRSLVDLDSGGEFNKEAIDFLLTSFTWTEKELGKALDYLESRPELKASKGPMKEEIKLKIQVLQSKGEAQ